MDTTYDITLEVGLPPEAVGERQLDFYSKIGWQLERMGISCTVSTCDQLVRFDMTLTAKSDEEAHDSGLMALITASLFVGATEITTQSRRNLDANSHN